MVEGLVGGLIIGIASGLLLFLNGRISGISGILLGALRRGASDRLWRVLFILGLLVGGMSLRMVRPQSFDFDFHSKTIFVVVAGLLVGFGTSLGSGCTSGHGVCGISRFSKRSVAATIVFMAGGFLSASFFRAILGVAP